MPKVIHVAYDESHVWLSNGSELCENELVVFAHTVWTVRGIKTENSGLSATLWPEDPHDYAHLYVKGAPGIPELPRPDQIVG